MHFFAAAQAGLKSRSAAVSCQDFLEECPARTLRLPGLLVWASPRVHHDALEFPDGTCVLLTDLLEGQEVTVLQLPAQPQTPAEEAAQRRVVYVG
jgi:hypothetical protein